MESLFDQSSLIHRAGGSRDKPALIYLPGVHGDWTHLWRARPLLRESFHLVEVAYPRVSHWTLPDFAAAIERMLDELQIERAHFIGESFSSLVGWEFALTRPQRALSLTLVGGFAQPPGRPKVHLAHWGLRMIPTAIFESGVNAYCVIRGKRPGTDEDSGAAMRPYPAVRTHGGRLATARRLHLISRADYRPALSGLRSPVRYIGGAWDMIVPVRREIATLETALPPTVDFKSHLISRAGHMIITTHPGQTTERIVEWIQEIQS